MASTTPEYPIKKLSGVLGHALGFTSPQTAVACQPSSMTCFAGALVPQKMVHQTVIANRVEHDLPITTTRQPHTAEFRIGKSLPVKSAYTGWHIASKKTRRLVLATKANYRSSQAAILLSTSMSCSRFRRASSPPYLEHFSVTQTGSSLFTRGHPDPMAHNSFKDWL